MTFKNKNYIIAPSILSSNFLNLRSSLQAV